MAIPSGLAAQIGFKTETTVGTGVTVDTFVPLVSESIGQDIERVESAGIIAGRRIIDTDQWKPGNKTVSGDIGCEVYEQSMGTLLLHALGTVNTAGGGPYNHTFTAGSLTGKALTIQIGVPGVDGTVRTKTYAGCKFPSWEIAGAAGEIVTFGASVFGSVTDEDTSVSLASASYATQATRPFIMTDTNCSISLAGSAHNVKSFTLSGENPMDTERRFIGTDMPAEPLEAGDRRTIGGTIEAEFEDLTEYNRYVSGSEFAIVITLSNGTESLVATLNARYDGETPKVAGKEIVGQTLPFKAIGDGSDADAFSLVYTSDDATVA